MKCRFFFWKFSVRNSIPCGQATNSRTDRLQAGNHFTLVLFELQILPALCPWLPKVTCFGTAYLQTPLVNKHAHTEKPTEFPILQWGPQPPAPPMKLHSFLSKFDRVDCPTITLETASGPPAFSKPYHRSHSFDVEVKFQRSKPKESGQDTGRGVGVNSSCHPGRATVSAPKSTSRFLPLTLYTFPKAPSPSSPIISQNSSGFRSLFTCSYCFFFFSLPNLKILRKLKKDIFPARQSPWHLKS